MCQYNCSRKHHRELKNKNKINVTIALIKNDYFFKATKETKDKKRHNGENTLLISNIVISLIM